MSNRIFSSSSTFCCSWLISYWIWADFKPFLELLLFWEDYFFLELLSFCLESDWRLFVLETWANPEFPTLKPNFLLLAFFSLSFYLRWYSRAPGTGNLLCNSIDYFSRERHENGFMRKFENSASTVFLISSWRISYSVLFYYFIVSSMSQEEAKTLFSTDVGFSTA